MAGTREGGLKTAATNKLHYDEVYKHEGGFYPHIGSRGGSRGEKDGTIKGFALDPERAKTAGAKGGKASRKSHHVLDLRVQPSVKPNTANRLVAASEREIEKAHASWLKRLFGHG